jgi:hypothetical protein
MIRLERQRRRFRVTKTLIVNRQDKKEWARFTSLARKITGVCKGCRDVSDSIDLEEIFVYLRTVPSKKK